jgi:hypothetical protein
MENLAQVFIYIIAIMGIIFTTISFSEIYNYKKISYSMFEKKIGPSKNVEIVVKFYGLNKEEEEKILDKLTNGKYSNIQEIADSVNIEKNLI